MSLVAGVSEKLRQCVADSLQASPLRCTDKSPGYADFPYCNKLSPGLFESNPLFVPHSNVHASPNVDCSGFSILT